MRILITNDDGVWAPGLELLAKIASEFGETVVVAPDTEQSGISHRISFERPVKIKDHGKSIFSVTGTPADCVRVAIWRESNQFDWVLSGVNNGANLGCDAFYSGTVAAAREASLLGVPAIAISQYRKIYSGDFDWAAQASTVRRVLETYLTKGLGPRRWINVNLPDNPTGESRIVECGIDGNPLPASYVETDQGVAMRFRYADRPRDKGEDIDVCFAGDISVSIRDLV